MIPSVGAWRRALPLAGLVALLLAGCSTTDELLVPESGGEGTTETANQNAFGTSARNLDNDERRLFEVGDSFFTQNWVTAPSSTDARDGLGPLLNAQACASCHLRDGRGSADPSEPGLLFRLSIPDGDGTGPDPSYGDQLQDRSILGVPHEGVMSIIYVEEPGSYPDGTPYTLRRPVYELDDLQYGDISTEVMVSPRLAPAVIGSGLLEAIPEADIVGAADPEDADGDGISGRPNYLTDPATGDQLLGRFGWKANVATVADQVAGAFLGDIGITSTAMPDENCTIPQVECAEAPNGGMPEVSDEIFSRVVFYTQTLAVPMRRNLDSPDVESGAKTFDQLGCGACHQPSFETGEHEVEALANQTIFPFTDLLLHDMGEGLADDRPDGMATGTEWRTPPLWGIGLTGVVNGHENYLHDGRARSLEEAILWHGGEGEAAASGFRELSTKQRSELLAFLESL